MSLSYYITVHVVYGYPLPDLKTRTYVNAYLLRFIIELFKFSVTFAIIHNIAQKLGTTDDMADPKVSIKERKVN